MTDTRTKTLSALNRELDELMTRERPRLLTLLGDLSGDSADHADSYTIEIEVEQIDRRIERLTEQIAELTESGDAGSPGIPYVVLDFGAGPEKALLSSVRLTDDQDVLHISPESPAGIALSSAQAGQTVTYRGPTGREISVQVLAVGADDVAA